MLTNDKIKVLSVFIHSRLSGKHTSKLTVTGSIFSDTSHTKELQSELDELIESLEAEGKTVDHINNLPDGYYRNLLVYYYETALNTMEKFISTGEEMIEGLIALSMLSYILQEKQAGVVLTDKKPSDLMEYFEKFGLEKRLVYKMIDVGTHIVESVDKANYALYLKRQRKKPKKKKRK